MDPIQRVARQLERCAEDYNEMVASDDIVVIEDKWHDFLTHLDRFWNLADRFFSQFDEWREYRQPYWVARQQDPLLKYLRVARDTVEHTIEEVQVRTPVNIKIEPGESGGTISNVQIFEDGSYSADTHIQYGSPDQGPVVTYKMEIHLLPVKVSNRKRGNETIDPPTSHLNEEVVPHTFVVASKGFEYYKTFFNEALQKFTGGSAT